MTATFSEGRVRGLPLLPHSSKVRTDVQLSGPLVSALFTKGLGVYAVAPVVLRRQTVPP